MTREERKDLTNFREMVSRHKHAVIKVQESISEDEEDDINDYSTSEQVNNDRSEYANELLKNGRIDKEGADEIKAGA